MELTTLVAQLVLKARLWRIVKNCQTIFKLFGLFYENVSFWGYKFFSPISYPVNSVVSKVAPMYGKIHGFDEKIPEKMASNRQRLIEKDFAIYAWLLKIQVLATRLKSSKNSFFSIFTNIYYIIEWTWFF